MHVLRSIRRTYVVALALIAFLTVASHALLESALVGGEDDGHLINVAGRQRMLSQRIAKAALAVDAGGGADARIELGHALREFRDAHDELVDHGSTSLEIRLALEDLDHDRKRLIANAASILAAPPGSRQASEVAAILAAADRFLPRMHEVVGMYQAAADERVRGTEALALGLGGLTLLVLALECIFVFEPLRRALHARIRELHTARLQAESALGARERFLSTVSHEIRTPLNGVIGMNELMRDTELSADQLDLVDTLGASASTLKDLLDDVLDFAKMSGGALDLERVPFDLHAWIEDASAPVGFAVARTGVEAIVEVEGGLPEEAFGDPTRLRQIVANLAGNAIKFTERGHIVLRFRRSPVVDGLRIEVEDSGIGIAPDRVDAIFDRFTQEDSSTTRRFGGTGLGLSIVRELAEQMGGAASVRSEQGVGTCFTVDVAMEMHARTVSDEVDREGTCDLRGKTVWVVDDHPVNRRYMRALLERWGATFRAFEDAKTFEIGCATLEERPDVLLVDHHLPGRTGVDIARALKRDPDLAGIPRILLSSVGDEEDADEVFDLRLLKPILPKRLARALGALLGVGAGVESEMSDEGPAELDGLIVLAAEDNPVNRKLLGAHARALGIELTVAEHGEEAVELARARAFDLILMDCQMPVMDGLAATRELREDSENRETPVIALTAAVGDHDHDRCLDAGMNELLGKPYTREELASSIRRWAPARRSSEAPAA